MIFPLFFIKNIDQCIINYDNIIVMGDLNFDMLNDKKCQTLKDLCDVLDFSQLVLKPTCFMKNCIPSRAPTTLKSEGEVTSLSGADKREVRDNREKW